MQLQPEILECLRGESELTYRLRIPSGLAFFEGHFPGFPVLPGVVQIDWAVDLGRSLLAPDAAFDTMRRVKFMRPITGDTEMTLALSATGGGNTLAFKYCDADHVYSSGQLLFGS